MISFENGKKFGFSMRLVTTGKENVPFITTTIRYQDRSEPVIGKVDTGAFRTILNRETADILGIELPPDDSPDAKKARTATGKSFKYFEYSIYFCFSNKQGEPLTFPVRAGFSRKIVNNLFGVDWLNYVCLGIDKESIHLLKD